MDWEDSPWLDALDGTAAGCWPRVLCWVKRSGSGGRCKEPDPNVLARRWRVPRESVEALLMAAVLDGALRVERGEWVVTKWAEFQSSDATGAERQARWRAGKAAGRETGE
jgi:hypothetical protein